MQRAQLDHLERPPVAADPLVHEPRRHTAAPHPQRDPRQERRGEREARGRADEVEHALARLVERMHALEPEPHERQVVDQVELGARGEHLEQVRDDAERDPEVFAGEHEREHARVTQRGHRDEDLFDLMADRHRAQVVDVAEHRDTGDVLLGQLGRIVEQAHDVIAIFGVVLELLQQPDRGDARAHDQHAQVRAARAAQVALEPVEEHPARALEHEVHARAREHDQAAERELLEEEPDCREHEQAQHRAAQELRELVHRGMRAAAAVDPEPPAGRDPGHHHDRQCAQIPVERIDRAADRLGERVADAIRREPSDRDEQRIGRDVQRAHRPEPRTSSALPPAALRGGGRARGGMVSHSNLIGREAAGAEPFSSTPIRR